MSRFSPDPSQSTLFQYNLVGTHSSSHLSTHERSMLAKQSINIIPIFDGNNVKLSHFISLCYEARQLLSNYSDKEFLTLVRTKLTGQAQAIILGKSFDCFNDLVKYLKSIFSPCHDFFALSGTLESTYQKNDETVLSYASRIREIAVQIFEESENFFPSMSLYDRKEIIDSKIVDKFIQGLRKELRSCVKTRTNFDEAVQEAVCEERLSLRDQLLIKSSLVNDEESNLNVSKVHYIADVCQMCDEPHHTALNCPLIIARKATTSPVICQFCSRPNHIAKNCYSLHPNLRPNHFNRNFSFSNNGDSRNRPPFYCNHCNRHGHTNERCFRKLRMILNDTVCKCCDRQGHAAQDCPLLDEAAFFCATCKQPGHNVYNCQKTIALLHSQNPKNGLNPSKPART